MLRIFKKRNEITQNDLTFLKSVTSKLPAKYAYLLPQINEDFILGKKPNQLGSTGAYTLLLNAKLSKKYSNNDLPSLFILKGIKARNSLKKDPEPIELDIMNGMIAGFLLTSDYKEIDFDTIDVSELSEKHFDNDEAEEVKKIWGEIPERIMTKLDLSYSFEIEIPEGSFFTIKELGDGDYLSIDDKGSVYKMTHDPYKIDKIFENKDAFYSAVESGFLED